MKEVPKIFILFTSRVSIIIFPMLLSELGQTRNSDLGFQKALLKCLSDSGITALSLEIASNFFICSPSPENKIASFVFLSKARMWSEGVQITS